MFDVRPGPLNALDAGALEHQSIRLPHALHAPLHGLVLAFGQLQVAVGDGAAAQAAVALPVKIELLAVGLHLLELRFCLLDLLLAVAGVELNELLPGGIEVGPGMIVVGLVIGHLQHGQHFVLRHAHAFLKLALAVAQLDDHAADLGADQDLVRRDDVTLALDDNFAGGGHLGIEARSRIRLVGVR